MWQRHYTRNLCLELEQAMRNDRPSSSLHLGRIEVSLPDVKIVRKLWSADNDIPGLGVSVLRSCVINAIFFSNFEFLKKRINALDV